MSKIEAVGFGVGMSTQSTKPSAVSRLLELVGKSNHDYRPSTEIFLELNPDRVADELGLVARGRERGSGNRPTTQAQTLDDIEHQVVERVEAHKQHAHSIYLEHLHTYGTRMAALNFEERFAIIRQAAPEAVGDFRAEAALGRDELSSLRRRLYDSEQERDDFRARNRLARPARLSTSGKTTLKIGLLAAMFVIEVAVNGSFLAKANLSGLLGGAVQAVSFAALNIIASFLFGLVPIRLVNRRQFLLKLIGLVGLAAYLAFAGALNLTLAHLREIPPSLTVDVGQEVLSRLATTPLLLHDVNSWVFFGIGFVFSVIAMADGLMFTDPYFGYGALEKRCHEARLSYTDGKTTLIERLRDIRDAETEAMNNAARDLSVQQEEFDAILQGRDRLSQRFAEHQNHIERSCRALMAIYREANQKARTTPAPAYWSESYNLQRIAPLNNETAETARAELRISILKSQEILQDQVKAIHETFDQSVLTYREIDELIPEQNIATS